VRSEQAEARLGDRGLVRARAGASAQAAGVVQGRRPVPIGGTWRFAGAGHDRLATHARACVASSLRCGSDRSLRVSTPAQAGLRRSVGQAAGCRVTSVGVKTRRCADVSYSTCWGYRRRCRVAPTSSGFDSPGDKESPRYKCNLNGKSAFQFDPRRSYELRTHKNKQREKKE